MHQVVGHSVLRQGTCLVFGVGAHVGGSQSTFLSHIDVSLTLKSINVYMCVYIYVYIYIYIYENVLGS